MIFSLVSEKLEGFRPKKGEPFEKKHFSRFNFSKIFGDFEIIKEKNNQKNLLFTSYISFFLSAPYNELLEEFVNRIEPLCHIQLGRGELVMEPLKVIRPPVFPKPVTLVRTLSPIAVSNPKAVGDRFAKKEYLSPKDPEFFNQIYRHLLDNYRSFYGRSPQKKDLTIKPYLFDEKRNSHFIKFKDFSIKGYSGIYKLTGSKELKAFAYDCGLGENNAQGFGMFDIFEEKKNIPEKKKPGS
jgi:CRISPR-associated endoribonuclease Cas6